MKNLKKSIIMLLAALFSILTLQAQSYEENMKRDLDFFCAAVVDSEVDQYLTFSDDNYIEINGGDSLFKTVVVSDMKNFDSSGMIKESISFLSSSKILTVENEMQSLVTVETIIQIAAKKFRSEHQIFAVSRNEGKSWKFIDLENHDSESIKIFIPNFNDGHTLSEKKNVLAVDE